MICSHCQSSNTQKRGTRNGKQRFFCNECSKSGLADLEEVQTGVTDAELLERQREVVFAREQRSGGKRIVKALEREIESLKTRQDFLDALEGAPAPKPYSIKSNPKGANRSNNATYAMLASDWHMGERVRPEAVGWRNEYDPDIAAERAEQFFRSNLLLLNAARSAWEIRQGLLWLGGDLMTGYIHEEYEEDNFLSPTEESLLVFRTFKQGIDFLLAKSDLEHIMIPTSNGNHGRTGKKPKIATAYKNSYEWLVYQLLDEHYRDESRVTFQIANAYHNYVDVYGFRLRFHHGDEVKYGGGVGGITVPLYRRMGRQAEGGDGADCDCLGHHHSLGFARRTCTNGSLIGDTPFGVTKGFGHEEPLQASFVIDEKYQLMSNMNPVICKPKGLR